MKPKTLEERTAAAVEAYQRGDGLLLIGKTFRIHHRTLERALEEAGIERRPPPGRGVSYKRKPGRPLGSKANFNDYVPGRIVKPCIRCKEKPSHPGAGGRCWTCDNTKLCRCVNPVPLTSTPGADCKRCGFSIRLRRAG